MAHIASPLVVGVRIVEQDCLPQAVQGTTSLFKSALSVKFLEAVVITSSFAVVFDPMHSSRPGYAYIPKDWSLRSYPTAADPYLDLSVWAKIYRDFITSRASKKLAEKAAWGLYDTVKPFLMDERDQRDLHRRTTHLATDQSNGKAEL
ncbi:uncharacterized protein Z518_01172 [Rhinocladiella mackenziei CBS 650.93]|uniref:3-beta hydroxysteroid dehydrogenase/isomerase domain-containing protein n=1 Tax=Rhinocladiella mackenziei CBS 650.93 TaxID=1442369 RepID=A0A0D2J355_9EURO|nr:uncharacterized protein Z518_01172 [Rhinocladiella mackenziei CBS 650.93]KIX10091.1 hypothetical protein Z518_01172 [Rhinocladiella mackenziei CBS 650.93]